MTEFNPHEIENRRLKLDQDILQDRQALRIKALELQNDQLLKELIGPAKLTTPPIFIQDSKREKELEARALALELENKRLREALEWTSIEECKPAPHKRYEFLCQDGSIWKGAPCYGMHSPWWCTHGGEILSEKGHMVTHWRLEALSIPSPEPSKLMEIFDFLRKNPKIEHTEECFFWKTEEIDVDGLIHFEPMSCSCGYDTFRLNVEALEGGV